MSRRLRRHGPALLAIALWVPTAAVLGWVLLSPADGPATPAQGDSRQAIEVSAADAAVISQVMRDNLRGYQAILEAAAEDDLAEVARVAQQTADSPGPARRSPTLDQGLPKQWRLMGRQVHDSLRTLATVAVQPDGRQQVQAELARTTAACLACHDSFRLVVSD